ncbi:hypothetical protein [Kitasatospora sp. NPDC057500]|uniref:hypothetical protein n=1 Tax=Kitasatospora sp. NPDC057500 TaxID=3346151 RepID=UPI0036A7290D
MVEPDAVGVLLSGPADALLSVVLFRGGWADADFTTGAGGAGALPGAGIGSAAAFGRRLDAWVALVFGDPRAPQPAS